MNATIHFRDYPIAGHLPQKQQDYKKKYRTLASTYVTYSPDGNELLVNLGGEQIYLFDVNNRRNLQRFDLAQLKGGANVAFKGWTLFSFLSLSAVKSLVIIAMYREKNKVEIYIIIPLRLRKYMLGSAIQYA